MLSYLSRYCHSKNVNWSKHNWASVEGCQTFLFSADGTCLLNSGVVHVTCTGFQKEVILHCIFTENVKSCTLSKVL